MVCSGCSISEVKDTCSPGRNLPQGGNGGAGTPPLSIWPRHALADACFSRRPPPDSAEAGRAAPSDFSAITRFISPDCGCIAMRSHRFPVALGRTSAGVPSTAARRLSAEQGGPAVVRNLVSKVIPWKCRPSANEALPEQQFPPVFRIDTGGKKVIFSCYTVRYSIRTVRHSSRHRGKEDRYDYRSH